MWKRAAGRVRDWTRELRAAREFGRACELIRRGRLPEAAMRLKRVLESFPPGEPRASASRFMIAQVLSITAARLADPPTALAAIRVALPIWPELEPKIRSRRRRHELAEWAAWAERYERAAAGE